MLDFYQSRPDTEFKVVPPLAAEFEKRNSKTRCAAHYIVHSEIPFSAIANFINAG